MPDELRSPAASSGVPGITVNILEPERMNLLGLMLASLLRRRLADRVGLRHARALSGSVVIEASAMRVTLSFEGANITIARNECEEPLATISGTLTALLDAALARHRLRSIFGGKLRGRGHPATLWHLGFLLKA